ncbi:hypothetical protein HPB50_000009 [Hyalomma asiaticum]|uniref:Uncharacterized protein n=1 Tax=Hyalomma asiaticum TaxID=266040 RepID=A0ACB7RWZ3_HYAAI|nr:hypothetical protein HPB50_000009 [Hyalomma asiaticum]
MPCLGQYGGPMFPYIGLGNVNGDLSVCTLITILVTNDVNASLLGTAIGWERKFIDTLKNFSNPNISVASISENSVEDELESQSNMFTVLLSYFVMFVYVSLALGRSFKTALVDFQGCSVTGARLIIIEVIPFFVLAVGVDNIFILIQGFQRDDGSEDEPIEDKVAHVLRLAAALPTLEHFCRQWR